MAARLSVNLNAVALLRNRRDLPWPSVAGLGRIALDAGAHGLTVHPRPDQRHIRFSDLPEIRAVIDAHPSAAEFNIEGYPTDGFLDLVEANRPDQVTLVPDDPAQATSDHGWDVARQADFLAPIVDRLRRGGFRISLFVDPGPQPLALAASLGVDRVEIYTGPYGAAFGDAARAQRALDDVEAAAKAALAAGLDVNAGHDLVIANLPALIARVPAIAEVSIGHGLTADALEHGMAATVRRFLKAAGWPAA